MGRHGKGYPQNTSLYSCRNGRCTANRVILRGISEVWMTAIETILHLKQGSNVKITRLFKGVFIIISCTVVWKFLCISSDLFLSRVWDTLLSPPLIFEGVGERGNSMYQLIAKFSTNLILYLIGFFFCSLFGKTVFDVYNCTCELIISI